MFKKVASKTVYKDPWLQLAQDEIKFSNGQKGTYGVIRRKNGAFALLHTPLKEVLLVKQYRYPINDYDWGLPGGGINEGEDPETAARRETKEETGIDPGSLKRMTEMFPLSSCSTEKVTIFLGEMEQLQPQKLGQPDEELAEVKVMPLKEAINMIKSGEIKDPMTCTVLLLLKDL